MNAQQIYSTLTAIVDRMDTPFEVLLRKPFYLITELEYLMDNLKVFARFQPEEYHLWFEVERGSWLSNITAYYKAHVVPFDLSVFIREQNARQQREFDRQFRHNPGYAETLPPGIATQCLIGYDLNGASIEQIDAHYRLIVTYKQRFEAQVNRPGQTYNDELLAWQERYRGDAYAIAKHGKTWHQLELEAEDQMYQQAIEAGDITGWLAWQENDSLKH